MGSISDLGCINNDVFVCMYEPNGEEKIARLAVSDLIGGCIGGGS